MADEFKGITQIIGMIPRGGRFAKSVVNFVHKVPQNWEKFKSAIQQIDDVLKQGKLKLDGKQKTIFESNKNILKNHEKVQKSVFKNPPYKSKEYPPFNVSKEDFTKGWKPTVIERQNLRNIYKDKLNPPERLYTKEMEAIDEELNELMLYGSSKYSHLSAGEKAKIFKKLQAEMQKLIKVAKDNDPTKLSLSQLNKKSHDLQRRIREIADNPDIKGTVYEGPKKDMIAAIYDSENAALTKARYALTRKNSELKYGKEYPVLDPENDAFIVIGLDERGQPIKMGRFTGKFSATKGPLGDLTRNEGTSFYDKWNSKTGKIRKEGEEVFTNTVNREGKEIMSNPDYKVPKTPNLDIQTEFYTDLSTSDLFKKGYKLKQIDMIIKGRKVREYLDKTKSKDTYISMHEQTSTNEIGAVLEDIYNRGDDVYKMSMKEWVKKIPEYFAGGGRVAYGEGTGGISNFFKNLGWEGIGEELRQERQMMKIAFDIIPTFTYPDHVSETTEQLKRYKKHMGYADTGNFLKDLGLAYTRGAGRKPGEQWAKYRKFLEMENYEKANQSKGFATGGVSNLFRERQGYRSGETVIKLAKGARWLIRMLKEMSDDMIFGRAQFAKMTEALKMKYFKETQSAIKHLEAGNPIPENLLKTMRNDPRFQNLTVSKTGDKDFIEMQEVVLADKFPLEMRKFMNRPLKEKDFVEIDLMEFKKELPADIIANLNKLAVEDQTVLLTRMKKAFDAAQKGGTDKGIDVLQEHMLIDFIPKGKPHATGGLIQGYATGGVSNLFRSR